MPTASAPADPVDPVALDDGRSIHAVRFLGAPALFRWIVVDASGALVEAGAKPHRSRARAMRAGVSRSLAAGGAHAAADPVVGP